METVSSYFGCKPPAKTYGRKSNSGLLVGLEIELEKVFIKAMPHGWHHVRDGSLKDNGKEFTIPVWHNHADAYLTDLFHNLDNPNASPRCSVHVHCDVTTFSLDQIKSLIILYTIFEKALYRFSGNRWDNIYCVPFRTWGIGLDLNRMDMQDIASTFQKYSGINVFPDDGKNGRLGTVEFRHMRGNKNVMYIKTWIDMLVQLVKYSKEQSYEALKKRIYNMRLNSQYWELFQDIFHENARTLNYSEFDKDVEEGITFAKLISFVE